MLQTNPLFKRLDNGSTPVPKAPLVPKKDILQFPPPRNQPPRTTTPSGPATSVALTRSESSPQLSSPAITIAGTASSSVILSNLAPTVSVEDIKGTLAGIGGGVREVHIMSRSGKSGEGLQVKVTFNKPAEGGKECIARFNGVVADGTFLTVLDHFFFISFHKFPTFISDLYPHRLEILLQANSRTQDLRGLRDSR